MTAKVLKEDKGYLVGDAKIKELEQCTISDVSNRRELLLDFANYSERDKTSQTTNNK